MRASHFNDDGLAVWTAPDSLATNLAELDNELVYGHGFDLHQFLAGRRGCGGQHRGGLPQTHYPSPPAGVGVPEQLAAPATPIDSHSLPRGVASATPYTPSSQDHQGITADRGFPSASSSPYPRAQRRSVLARLAVAIAAAGVLSLAILHARGRN